VRQHRGRLLTLAAVGLLIAGALIAAHHFGWLGQGRLRAFAGTLQRSATEPRAMLMFVAAFVLVVLLGLPATPMDLIGGAVFGFWVGLALNWFSLVVAATLGYWIAYSLGHDTIGRWLRQRPRWRRTLAAVEGPTGVWTLLRLQVLPFVPPALLNYAAGAAHLNFGRYLLSAALGHLPPTAVFTWFANRLLAGATGAAHRAYRDLAIAVALVLLVSFVPRLWRSRAEDDERQPH
jgi:uncharacterized membrane protein YdjX (TVP38/TMEM64 family)